MSKARKAIHFWIEGGQQQQHKHNKVTHFVHLYDIAERLTKNQSLFFIYFQL